MKNVFEKLCEILSKHMAIIVLLVAIISLIEPKSSLWIKTNWINYLLMLVMFGMGLTLKIKDFIHVFKEPKYIVIGCIAQYLIMPLAAFILCCLFKLDSSLWVGVILVGACPGGTSSNVITYLSNGNVPLSICMTSVNTLLAPIFTPLIAYFLLQTTVKIDIISMFLNIFSVIVIPILFGFIINKLFFGLTQKITKILPIISIVSICLIVASVVSHNAKAIYANGLIILFVVILHNLFGYLAGFLLGKCLKLPVDKIKAFSIEIGMQNSGLAVSIANTSFPQLTIATVPGAIFSVWHNISGGILSGLYRNWNLKK